MKATSNQPPPRSLEEGAQVLFSDAQESIRHRYHECEEQIRKSPATAMFAALAVGYLLHRLPVRAILVTKVRVLSALAPPTLFFFGAAKLYDFLQKQEREDRK